MDALSERNGDGGAVVLRRDLLGKAERKNCTQCGRYLDIRYPSDICPVCQEINLFAEVKDYIRNNDVRETDVADHFNISIHKVREWIREGRIQYKGIDEKNFVPLHCHVCGKPIEFGSICPKCLSNQKLQVVLNQKQYEEAGRMRFLNDK